MTLTPCDRAEGEPVGRLRHLDEDRARAVAARLLLSQRSQGEKQGSKKKTKEKKGLNEEEAAPCRQTRTDKQTELAVGKRPKAFHKRLKRNVNKMKKKNQPLKCSIQPRRYE